MNRWFTLSVLISLALLLAASLQAGSAAGGDFSIVKSTIDNGGGVSSGGNFVLKGSIGQHDASPQTASGGNFRQAGGFWAQVAEIAELIFRDGFETASGP